MTRQFILILTMFTLFSCSKGGSNPSNPMDDDDLEPPKGMVVAMGSFTGNRGYAVSGEAKIYEDAGKKELRLEKFNSSNGPDLKVYLATDVNASTFINLGKLKSTVGDQAYPISGMPNFSEYKYVLIWCEQFTVRFGAAPIN